MNYDRLYDLLTLAPIRRWWYLPCNCPTCNDMRGTGVEPVSLAAPDPKSGTPLANDTPSEGNPATDRHPAPSIATRTTTESTTDTVSLSRQPRRAGERR
jgi:hypothetical protein